MNKYFYINSEGKQTGTFAPEELRAENIKRDTLVWTNDMTDWRPAEEVEELKFLLTLAFRTVILQLLDIRLLKLLRDMELRMQM